MGYLTIVVLFLVCIYRLADVVLGSSVKFRNFQTASTKNFRQLVIGSRSRVLGLTLNVFQIVDFLDSLRNFRRCQFESEKELFNDQISTSHPFQHNFKSTDSTGASDSRK